MPGEALGEYDVAIVGGGIYGAMLAMESQGRGLSTLLVERGDFGAGTSFNNLRTIHGGLRYLQSADLARFNASVRARRWFLKTFPDLVKPLGCLMPLTGRGLHRPAVMAVALMVNDLLAFGRNRGLPVESRLPNGSVVGPEEIHEICPAVDTRKYPTAALWHDACLPDSPRLLVEVLRWAESKGAQLRNYTEAEELVVRSGSVVGLRCRDVSTGERLEVRARNVVIATGTAVPETLERFGLAQAARWQPSLAWNLVLDRPPPSSHAVAVSARANEAIRFLHPFHGRCIAGTWHELTSSLEPTPEQVDASLADLNAALPGFDVRRCDVVRVMAGALPAEHGEAMKLTARPDVIDHERVNGVRGLFSVTGIKFTTAQTVAHKLMNRVRPFSGQIWTQRPAPIPAWRFMSCELETPWTRRRLEGLMNDEWVVRPEDLAERRTNLWELGRAGQRVARRMFDLRAKRSSEYCGNGTDDG